MHVKDLHHLPVRVIGLVPRVLVALDHHLPKEPKVWQIRNHLIFRPPQRTDIGNPGVKLDHHLFRTTGPAINSLLEAERKIDTSQEAKVDPLQC